MMKNKIRNGAMTMKHKKFQPDICGWELDSLANISATIEKHMKQAINEVLRYAHESESSYVYFPAQFDEYDSDGIGGDINNDPLIAYLRLDITSESELPTYSINIREAFESEIKEPDLYDAEHAESILRISRAMKDLAMELEGAAKKMAA